MNNQAGGIRPSGCILERMLNETLELLASRPRRRLLVALLHADADARLQLPADVFDADGSGELTLQLRHNHLPKLDRVGVISWDRETMQVGRGPEFDGIEPLLELLDDNPDALPGEWP